MFVFAFNFLAPNIQVVFTEHIPHVGIYGATVLHAYDRLPPPLHLGNPPTLDVISTHVFQLHGVCCWGPCTSCQPKSAAQKLGQDAQTCACIR